MKISEEVREYAAKEGLTSKEAIEKGMEEKSEEFAKKGSEIYS
jgi:phosphomethylpyrimidine synthase